MLNDWDLKQVFQSLRTHTFSFFFFPKKIKLKYYFKMDSDEELECPLCMEEFDIADSNFRPCPCGYQVN